MTTEHLTLLPTPCADKTSSSISTSAETVTKELAYATHVPTIRAVIKSAELSFNAVTRSVQHAGACRDGVGNFESGML